MIRQLGPVEAYMREGRRIVIEPGNTRDLEPVPTVWANAKNLCRRSCYAVIALAGLSAVVVPVAQTIFPNHIAPLPRADEIDRNPSGKWICPNTPGSNGLSREYASFVKPMTMAFRDIAELSGSPPASRQQLHGCKVPGF